MRRKIYVYFLAMPLTYTIMMLWEHRICSINNIISLIIYGFICMITGVIIVEVYRLFVGRKFREPIAILVLVSIDYVIKIIMDKIFIEPMIIFKDIWEISTSKNMNQNAIFNYWGIECSLLVATVIKIFLIGFILIIFMCFNKKYKTILAEYLNIAYIVTLSAALCSLLDTLYWGYTLDYIRFVDFMYCDIKDFYVDIGVSMFLVYYIKLQTLKENRKKGLQL